MPIEIHPRTISAIACGLLIFVIGLPRALAQGKPPPGETKDGYIDPKSGVQITPPAGMAKMVFRTSNFMAERPGMLCEFQFADVDLAPTTTGALLRADWTGDVTAWADRRTATIADDAAAPKAEVTAEKVLDRKVGQQDQKVLVREYKLQNQFATLLEQHAFISDGAGHVYELILSDNMQAADAAKPVMEKLIAGFSIGPPGAAQPPAAEAVKPAKPENPAVAQKPEGHTEKPSTKPSAKPSAKAVAGLAFVPVRKELDIFVLKDGETKPTNITNNSGDDCQPAWSPDGTRIAFISDRTGHGHTDGVYVMDSDGANVVKVTKEIDPTACNPRWSPDGTKLVYVTRGPDQAASRIQSINIDGTDLKVLAAEAGWSSVEPEWSPDGSKIVYRSATGKMLEGGMYVMNPDGTGKTCILPAQRANVFGGRPRWSPDGKQIIFTGHVGQEVAGDQRRSPFGVTMIMNADGTNLRWNHLRDDSEPMFLPKMNKIAFLSGHGGDYQKSGNGLDLFVKNVNGVHTVNITKDIGGALDFDYSPLSADELITKKVPYDIVFARLGGGGDVAYDIFVMTDEGKDLTNLTQTCTFYTRENNPCWSPDKKRIVFESNAPYWIDGEREGVYDHTNIWSMDADGSNWAILTRNPNGELHHPIWSPDGQQIAFIGLRGQSGYGLFIMDPTGAGMRELTFTGDHIENAHISWSRDGTMIIVRSHGKLRTVTPNTNPPVWADIDKVSDNEPDWNPAIDRVACFGTSAAGKHALLRFDFPGGADQLVIETQGEHPSWGPDGHRIAFHAPAGRPGTTHDIMIADSRRPPEDLAINLTSPFAGENVEPDWGAGPTNSIPPVAKGGTDCVVICCKTAGGYVCSMVKADGAEMKEIGRFKAARFMDDSPVFSANGKRCAVSSIENGKATVLVCDLDGKDARAIGEGHNPCLSPDGSRVSFVKSEGLGPYEVYMADLGRGGAPVRRQGGKSKSSGDDMYTAWSADNGTLYFASDFEARPGTVTHTLYSISADDSGQKKLWDIPDSRMFKAVRPSPDGKSMLVYCMVVTGQSEVYSINADGSGAKKILDGCFLPVGCWSDDGKRVYAARGGTIISCNPDGSDQKQLLQGGFNFVHWNPRCDKALLLGAAPSGGQGLFLCGVDGSSPSWLQKVKGDIVCVAWCGGDNPTTKPAGLPAPVGSFAGKWGGGTGGGNYWLLTQSGDSVTGKTRYGGTIKGTVTRANSMTRSVLTYEWMGGDGTKSVGTVSVGQNGKLLLGDWHYTNPAPSDRPGGKIEFEKMDE